MKEKSSLDQIREEIDCLDDELIGLLKNRLDLVGQMEKDPKSLTDHQRESYILNKIDSSYIQKIYKIIFDVSKESLRDKQSK